MLPFDRKAHRNAASDIAARSRYQLTRYWYFKLSQVAAELEEELQHRTAFANFHGEG